LKSLAKPSLETPIRRLALPALLNAF
jgi:hypothetical protein